LPERLIRLYTYAGDLILDPFMGSGTTLVAASRLDRRYVGYDLDPAYVEVARERVAGAGAPVSDPASSASKAIQAIAADVVENAGFRIIGRKSRLRGLGVTISLVAAAGDDRPWYFDVTGGFTTPRSGLHRAETAWASLGRAHVLANSGISPVVFLTSHMPRRSSEADQALHAAGTGAFFDAIEILSEAGQARLSAYATGGHEQAPLPGFWSAANLKSTAAPAPGLRVVEGSA
jgi:hypothetical protein